MPLRRALRAGALLAVGLLLAGPSGSARAELISDPLGDFLPTYTGPQNAGLDVVAHAVFLNGEQLTFFGRMAGPIAPTEAIGGRYVTGLDRGQGTARFLNPPATPPVVSASRRWSASTSASDPGPVPGMPLERSRTPAASGLDQRYHQAVSPLVDHAEGGVAALHLDQQHLPSRHRSLH